MNKKIICLLCAVSCSIICPAQQINPSSGFSVNTGISMDWILGGLSDIATDETGTSSFAAENGAIVPVITCNIYPTLTSGIITVEVAQMDSAEFRAEIFDFSGSKTLITELVRLPSQQINLTALSPGPYFIKISVVKTNQCLKTEKIIKY